MNMLSEERALTYRKEEPAPLSSLVTEDNTTILTGYPAVLTLGQAASVLQLGITTARQKCREGQLPCLKIGQQWRIPRAWLEKYILGGGC